MMENRTNAQLKNILDKQQGSRNQVCHEAAGNIITSHHMEKTKAGLTGLYIREITLKH